MGILLFPGRGADGPRPGTLPRLNRASALAPGLARWYVPGPWGVSEILAQRYPPVTAGQYRGDPRGGQVLVCNGTTTAVVDSVGLVLPRRGAVAIWHTPTTTAATQTLVAAANPAHVALQVVQDGPQYRVRITQQLAPAIYLGRRGGAVVPGTPALLIATWDCDTTPPAVALYAGGARIDTADESAGVFTGPDPALVPLTIAKQDAPGAEAFFAGTMGDLWLWDRPLSASEAASLTLEPWALYWVPARKLTVYPFPPVDPTHEIPIDAIALGGGPLTLDAFVGGNLSVGHTFEDDHLAAVALGADPFALTAAVGLDDQRLALDAARPADPIPLDAFVGDAPVGAVL